MASKNIRIAIIGGGIGGLTTAISLLQAGFDVQVYEQTRLLSEVGAGINISPNASRILIRLGLGEECASGGVPLAVLPSAPLGRWPHVDQGALATDIEKEFRRAAHDLPSRRIAFAAGQCRAVRARPSRAAAASASNRTARPCA
jgi:glycine/D-amino acid oxidase-like deaminating enzyme